MVLVASAPSGSSARWAQRGAVDASLHRPTARRGSCPHHRRTGRRQAQGKQCSRFHHLGERRNPSADQTRGAGPASQEPEGPPATIREKVLRFAYAAVDDTRWADGDLDPAHRLLVPAYGHRNGSHHDAPAADLCGTSSARGLDRFAELTRRLSLRVNRTT